MPTSNRPEVSLSRRCTGAGIKGDPANAASSRVVRLSVCPVPGCTGRPGRLAEHDDVSRLRNDGGQFLAARRRGDAFRFRSGPGKGRNPDFIVQFHPVERFGPAPPLIRTCPVRIQRCRTLCGSSKRGTGTQQLLPGFRRPSLAMVQAWHSFEKYGLSPCGGGAFMSFVSPCPLRKG